MGVAQKFGGTGGRRVQVHCPAQVLQGFDQLAAGSVNHAAFEVCEHGFRTDGNRAAVGLESLEGLVGIDRLVAGRNQPDVLAVGGISRINGCAGRRGYGKNHAANGIATHLGRIASGLRLGFGNISPLPGSNPPGANHSDQHPELID